MFEERGSAESGYAFFRGTLYAFLLVHFCVSCAHRNCQSKDQLGFIECTIHVSNPISVSREDLGTREEATSTMFFL